MQTFKRFVLFSYTVQNKSLDVHLVCHTKWFIYLDLLIFYSMWSNVHV